MTELPPLSPAPKRRFGLKLLLIGSLALNLIVVGLIAGSIFSGHYRGARGFHPPPGVRGYISAMTKPQRGEFLRETRRGDFSRRKLTRNLNRQQSGIISAIEADPFVRQAVADAMRNQREHVSSAMAGFHGALTDMLAEMSHEERGEFVRRYTEHGRNRWGKKRRRD